jgi:hypothetical protein
MPFGYFLNLFAACCYGILAKSAGTDYEGASKGAGLAEKCSILLSMFKRSGN